MALDWELARRFLERHPDRAADAIEQLGADEAAAVLARLPVESAAQILERVTAVPASRLLAAFARDRAAKIAETIAPDVAASYLRRLPSDERDAILAKLSARRQRNLGAMIRYPERSAGGLMDPEVLALVEDLTVGEARVRVREGAHHARYNVYLTDRSDVLVGVVNLREVLLGKPRQPLSQIATRRVMKLPAKADVAAIVSHPGWRQVHSLPVVDERGVYLGAIRYRTLRRLEAELRPPAVENQTSRALGDVFWVGLGGMVDVVAGPERR